MAGAYGRLLLEVVNLAGAWTGLPAAWHLGAAPDTTLMGVGVVGGVALFVVTPGRGLLWKAGWITVVAGLLLAAHATVVTVQLHTAWVGQAAPPAVVAPAPTATAANPRPNERTTLVNARADSPARQSTTVSKAKVLKVVKAPRKPVAMAARAGAEAGSLPRSRVPAQPSRRQPTTLTTSVSCGKPGGR